MKTACELWFDFLPPRWTSKPVETYNHNRCVERDRQEIIRFALPGSRLLWSLQAIAFSRCKELIYKLVVELLPGVIRSLFWKWAAKWEMGMRCVCVCECVRVCVCVCARVFAKLSSIHRIMCAVNESFFCCKPFWKKLSFIVIAERSALGVIFFMRRGYFDHFSGRLTSGTRLDCSDPFHLRVYRNRSSLILVLQ